MAWKTRGKIYNPAQREGRVERVEGVSNQEAKVSRMNVQVRISSGGEPGHLSSAFIELDRNVSC